MASNEVISKKTIISSFVWKIMERVFSQGINLLVQIVLARLLMPEDFGGLAILLVVINYASIFVQSGLGTAIVQKENLEKKDVSTLLVVSLSFAFVFYIVLFVISPMLSSYYGMPELKWALRVLALTLFLNAINSIQTAVLSRGMHFKRLFFRTLVAVPISGTVGIFLAYAGFGIWALVIHNLVNMMVIVAFMSIDKDMRYPLIFSVESAKQLYAFSWKILATSMITGAHDAVRTMVIGKKYDAESLAYYDKAYAYSGQIIQVIYASISGVLLPTFSRMQNNLHELKRMARRAVKLSAFVMFPVLLGIAAVAEPLVELGLGEKWMKSAPFLVVFCVLRIPGCIMTVDKQVYYALGRSGIALKYETVLLVFNISMLLVTMQYGTMWIALGAAAVEFIGLGVICCVSARLYSYSLKERIRDVGKPLILSLIMFVVVRMLGELHIHFLLKLLLQIVGGILVYLVMNMLSRDENLRCILAVLRSRRNVTKREY